MPRQQAEEHPCTGIDIIEGVVRVLTFHPETIRKGAKPVVLKSRQDRLGKGPCVTGELFLKPVFDAALLTHDTDHALVESCIVRHDKDIAVKKVEELSQADTGVQSIRGKERIADAVNFLRLRRHGERDLQILVQRLRERPVLISGRRDLADLILIADTRCLGVKHDHAAVLRVLAVLRYRFITHFGVMTFRRSRGVLRQGSRRGLPTPAVFPCNIGHAPRSQGRTHRLPTLPTLERFCIEDP